MILVTDHGKVRELRLNRPPVNALSIELMIALRQAVDAAAQDGKGALVLSGPPRRFCAGLDIRLLLTMGQQEMTSLWHELYALLRALACCPIPIAVAITGHAPAGGTAVALFCDWRIIAEGDWKLGLNEVRVGLVLPPIIFSALARQVGPRLAERLAVGGIQISPKEALAFGVVDELVPLEQVVERAIDWCNQMLALPGRAMTNTRRQARADLVRLFETDLGPELEEVIVNWWSDETQDVLKAVANQLGKRPDEIADVALKQNSRLMRGADR